MYMACIAIELTLDSRHESEHMTFEALGLVVLFLIYFSTIVDLIRKLRIFVLEETKLEGRLIHVQFLIFFVAYGSKIFTLMYWIRNPPQ